MFGIPDAHGLRFRRNRSLEAVFEIGASIHVETEVIASFGRGLIERDRIRRQIVRAVAERLEGLHERCTVRPKPVSRHPALETIIDRADILHRMENDGSHGARNGEGHRYELIQGGFVIATAHWTIVLVAHSPET